MTDLIMILGYIIIAIGLANLVRLAVMMLAADVYDVLNHRKFMVRTPRRLPVFTVLIPAYNEELCIEKTVRSVVQAYYPRKEIIVIDDGSTDGTADRVRALQRRYSRSIIQFIRQKNAGKGSALNNGIQHSHGSLVMVLDADSTIDKYSLRNSVKYFDDKRVKAVASSVRLDENGTWLGLIQRVEYLLSYRMKRSLTALNIEYIIGGVGSIYRRSTLRQVSGYCTNTITEDIDLSMKVIARGNKAYRVIFASDVKTCTQPVMTLKELISQRFRWKQGRTQAFIRYKKLFASGNKKYSKLLGWFQLPNAIFGEISLLLEPFFIMTIIAVAIAYSNPSSLILAFSIMAVFLIFNFVATDDESVKDKLSLVLLTPVIYLLLPVLAYVELVSLIRTLRNWRKLSPTLKDAGLWIHVNRSIAPPRPRYGTNKSHPVLTR
jgi:biofilm PGA synthesis N-glycosyltransferase PgaC